MAKMDEKTASGNPFNMDGELGGGHVDTVNQLYKESLLMNPAEREQIAKRVRTKLDWILLPLVSCLAESPVFSIVMLPDVYDIYARLSRQDHP